MFCADPAFNLWVGEDAKSMKLTICIDYKHTVQVRLTKQHAVAMIEEMILALRECE